MLKNKFLRIIAIVSITILNINLFLPIALAKDLNNEAFNDIIENNIVTDDNFIEDDKTIDEDAVNNISIENNTDTYKNVIQNNYTDVDDTIVENEDFSVNVKVSGYTINQYIDKNIYYLFLPQGIDISNLEINYTGDVTVTSSGVINKESKTIVNDFSQNNTIQITANENIYTITVIQTNLTSISISLKDTTLEELNSGSKDIKYKGNSLTLKTANNEEYDIIDDNVELKGRGNFTWTLPKKAYQFKLSSKENVLGMGKSKTWILLANYADNSLLRNKLTFVITKEIGLDYTGESNFVDLWIDGYYQGNYLLTEKVQVGDNRVELNDDNGLIVELDNNYYASEKNYFQSNISGSHFVLKDSIADDEGEANSISEKSFKEFENYLNEFETYLYDENKDWDKISSMIDVESFIKYYFIQEFTENPDGARSSSYMYKDGTNDVLHMGPVWDFDLALASCDKDNWGGNPEYDYIKNIKKYMEASLDWYTQLFKIPEFREEVSKIYNNEIKDILETATQKINDYEEELKISSDMNFKKWQTLGKENAFGSYRGHKIKDTYKEEVKYLYDWVSERINYLNKRYSENSDISKVQYLSHIQDYGWDQNYSIDGEMSGTEGQSKRLESIKIDLDSFNIQLNNATIKYQVHVQDYGWMDWKQNGEIAGTTGESKRIEAIKIQLDNAEKYSIQYRVHVQDIGWTNWKSDGDIAGTTGKSLRIEAIQIRLVQIPTNTISYTTHVQDIGWQPNVINGKMAGTEGRSKRLEGIKINILNNPDNLQVKYSTHIQDIGWQDWKYNGELSGTTGQSKRLEAIKIQLENSDDYTIKYRVHIQDIGWTNWVSDGEMAGTEGRSLRLEAIEIKLEKKI